MDRLYFIKKNSDSFNEVIAINEGRFTLVFTNPSVIVKHTHEEDFVPIENSSDRVYNKYFTYLYTDTGELTHRRID